jgi:transposase InsO family protein
MFGLADQRSGAGSEQEQAYPEAVAAHILYLKQLYPPIHYREIVRIIHRKFGYQTSHHRVKRFLQRHAIPVQLELDFKVYHDYEDMYQARWTVVRMYYEGWNQKSIAGCLKLSRRQVGRIIAAFEADGFAGLEDERTRPVTHPANQLTLPLLKEVLDIQKEYPRAGRFRVKGLLEQRLEHEPPSEATVGRAMALNRQFHGAPDPWSSAADETPPKEETTPKYLWYRPEYRHHLWFIDIRYLVKQHDHWVYSICILEGYSRTILAGMASEHQDLTVVLQILFAALSAYGCPEMIVSDNGAVFQAHAYLNILEALSIQPKYIDKGKPWQNLIEPQFKVQLRLADVKFEQTQTLPDLQNLHAEFIQTFNTTPHWAHRDRDDQRRTPNDVPGWVRGRAVDLNQLRQLFHQVEFNRAVNRYGFVRVQRFYIYAEHGLSRQRVSIWIFEGHLRVEYQETLLAQYSCAYDPQQKRLQLVAQPILYRTPFASPQLELFELDDDQWVKVYECLYLQRQRRFIPTAQQLYLLNLDAVA